MANHRQTVHKRRAGKANKKPWRKAKKLRQKRCVYCWEPFSKKNPPTFDHVEPLSRNHLSSKTVLACQVCNNLRGNAHQDTYMNAVWEERAAAKAERRPYQRPRLITDHAGRQRLTTATRRERGAAS